MTRPCFPSVGGGACGRGAKSNESGRLEAFTGHEFNDGWDARPMIRLSPQRVA